MIQNPAPGYLFQSHFSEETFVTVKRKSLSLYAKTQFVTDAFVMAELCHNAISSGRCEARAVSVALIPRGKS